MIPVMSQPEPQDFQVKVSAKGRSFLERNPHTKNWKYGSYWTLALPDLWNSYQGICAYCCYYIPSEQNATVDHFIPKSIEPEMAYEWRNYRLATLKMNARKGNSIDLIDPFELADGSLQLLFPAMLIRPDPTLPLERKEQILSTIKRLKLNADETLVQSRLQWMLAYCDGHISFKFLSRVAPFIAFEIERQAIKDQLPLVFRQRKYRTKS